MLSIKQKLSIRMRKSWFQTFQRGFHDIISSDVSLILIVHLADYRFLEDASRKADNCQRDPARRFHHLPRHVSMDGVLMFSWSLIFFIVCGRGLDCMETWIVILFFPEHVIYMACLKTLINIKKTIICY